MATPMIATSTIRLRPSGSGGGNRFPWLGVLRTRAPPCRGNRRSASECPPRGLRDAGAQSCRRAPGRIGVGSPRAGTHPLRATHRPARPGRRRRLRVRGRRERQPLRVLRAGPELSATTSGSRGPSATSSSPAQGWSCSCSRCRSGTWADRLGVRRVSLVTAALLAASALAHAVAVDLWSLLGARVLFAAAFTGMLTAAMAWLAGATPPERQARAIGGIMPCAGTGLLVGPYLAGAITDASGTRLAYGVLCHPLARAARARPPCAGGLPDRGRADAPPRHARRAPGADRGGGGRADAARDRARHLAEPARPPAARRQRPLGRRARRRALDRRRRLRRDGPPRRPARRPPRQPPDGGDDRGRSAAS